VKLAVVGGGTMGRALLRAALLAGVVEAQAVTLADWRGVPGEPGGPMMSSVKVTVIGGGKMGGALLHAALDAGVVEAGDVTVAEVLAKRRDQLALDLGVAVTESAEGAESADVVLIAVRPQDFGNLRFRPREDACLISIMAGIPIAAITRHLGAERVVRVMPNLPAAVRAGMSVWTATESVAPEQRAFAGRFLAAAGTEIYVDDEAKLDMAVAVSGSGPGYVYLLIEGLVEGGVAVGLARDQATTMAVQTFLGAAQYARDSAIEPAALRAMITSPGGTTAAGLLALEQRAVRAAMIEAVQAAHRRARELGGLA
jgi:pyrroline-5-carboxylate reductase